MIEHKIERYKDYSAAVFMGTFWIGLCALFSWGAYELLKTGGAPPELSTISAILVFCFGVYKGREFFEPVIREEVIHIIRRNKSGSKTARGRKAS